MAADECQEVDREALLVWFLFAFDLGGDQGASLFARLLRAYWSVLLFRNQRYHVLMSR